MKITYPECQLEITAEEFITVIDHFTTKVTCNIEPIFEPGGIVGTGDDMPEPKPYPNMLDNEAIIPRGSGFQDLIKKGLEEAEAQGKLPEDPLAGVIFDEPEPEPEPKQKSTRLKKPKKAMAPKDNEPVEKPKRKNKTNSKAVEVLLENGWKTFGSVSQAAAAIGSRLNHLSHALLNNKTCNGYQVRYAVDGKQQPETTNEEPTELP